MRTTPRFIAAVGLALAGVRAQAQDTSSFMDPATGITFQSFAQGEYTLGIALPDVAGADFIGHLSTTSAAGWAGVALAGAMRNSLMVVAFPDGDQVRGSIRLGTGYSSPQVFQDKSAKVLPIPEGTKADGTGYTYTFLCKDCIRRDDRTFYPDDASARIGFAWSRNSVSTPGDAASALTFHSGGYGAFGLDLAAARSAKFATWAAMAVEPETAPPPETTPPPEQPDVPVYNTTYDYIVVGGGASGIVTAQRLVETGKSVLLLERGGPSFYWTGGNLTVPWNDTTTVFEVPALFSSIATWPGSDAMCSDVAGIAGCLLGGGTAVNGMQYIHPPSFDFSDWPEGWRWADGVDQAAARLYARQPGTTNPSMNGVRYDNGVYDVVSKELDGIGWRFLDGLGDPDDKLDVYGPPSVSVANGRRTSPVNTYLPLAVSQPNFTLRLRTKAIRAVRTNSTITGVEVEDGSNGSNSRLIINVTPGTGKVILAAGAMSTPRLLFHSGIGPRTEIQTAQANGVVLPAEDAWIETPVGGPARDHSIYSVIFNVKGGMATVATQLANPTSEMVEQFARGSGPLALTPFRLNWFTRRTDANGRERLFTTHCWAPEGDMVVMLVTMARGLTSIGRLGLTRQDTTVWAESPYMRTQDDRDAMAGIIDEMLAMSRREGSSLVYIGPGGLNATGYDVIDQSTVIDGTHMVGTAKLGTDDGRTGGTAVVDLDTRVYGTDNLFVVDASMHADLPTGNTQAIVMVAAEHAVRKIIALDAKRRM